MSVNGDDHGKQRAVAVSLGAAAVAGLLLGRGPVSAAAIGAVVGLLAASSHRTPAPESFDADLRLAMVEGRIEQNTERIDRVLGLLEGQPQRPSGAAF